MEYYFQNLNIQDSYFVFCEPYLQQILTLVAESINENISENNDLSFSQDQMDIKEAEQENSNDLKEFGVDTEEPDLFSSENSSSTSEDLLGSTDEDHEEDDLEIPAFLRRQKN